MDAKLIASIVEMVLIPYIILKWDKCTNINIYFVSMAFSELIMILIYYYMPSIGIVGFMAIAPFCLVINSKSNIVKRMKIIVSIIPVVVFVQTVVFILYLLIGIDNSLLFYIFSTSSVILEFLVLKDILLGGNKIMTVFLWIGNKNKRTLAKFKKEKKS